MKLSFECHEDPRSMPTKHGKKFCENCQKHVYDIRHKSQAKVLEFYKKNPKACVIAYEHQIDRLPNSPIIIESSHHYIPYAASVLVISLLPTLTMAQNKSNVKVQITGTSPVPILDQQNIGVIKQQQSKNEIKDKYFLEGKVTITDKKMKVRKGKEIFVYRVLRDSQGQYLGEDTLAKGILQLNGKFKMEISKTTFGRLQIDNEDIEFNIDGFNYEIVKKISFSGNIVNAIISVAARRIVVGSW